MPAFVLGGWGVEVGSVVVGVDRTGFHPSIRRSLHPSTARLWPISSLKTTRSPTHPTTHPSIHPSPRLLKKRTVVPPGECGEEEEDAKGAVQVHQEVEDEEEAPVPPLIDEEGVCIM